MSDLEQPAETLDSAPAQDAGHEPNETDLEGLLDQQQTEPEEVEEEFEGLKLKGKKDLLEEFKKGRMLHRDYTQKTQEVAEQRRTFETERESFTKERQFVEQMENERFQLHAATQRFQQLQQAAAQGQFAALRQSNPEYADQLQAELAQLAAWIPGARDYLAQKTAHLKSEAERKNATRANESEQIVMREVRDWGPEKLKAFVAAGEKAGLPAEGVRQLLVQFPQASRFLNKALMYDQLLASRLKKPEATPAQPGTRLGGGAATHTKALSDVTDPREWQARRQEWKSRNR